jgi:hypothetical protein
MTDGQDFGWQPQQANSEQNWQDQPRQGNRYDTGTHRQRISALQPPPRPPEGTNWFQPGSRQQYPLPGPPSQPPYGPPGEPQDRKPWAARHKALTGLLACCGLVFIIGTAAAAGFSSSSSSSSSRSAAAASSPTVKAPATTASPMVKKAPVATHAVTTPSSTPAPATPAPPPTQPRTTAAVPKSAPSTPAHTTAAPTPSPTASKPPATCHPLTIAGKCYKPGGFCPKSDHGTSGVAGDGEAIECVDVANVGWRWEPT